MQIVDSNHSPKVIEWERQILGAMLYKGKLFELCANLSVDDFYNYTHRAIYAAMCEVYEEGMIIDVASVFGRLQNNKEFERAGGSLMLTALAHDCDTVNIEAYIKKVKEAAAKRHLGEQMQKAISLLDTETLSSVTDLMQEVLLGQSISTSQAIILADKPEPLPRQWLLGQAIPMAYPTILYGEGGLGKSIVALYLAVLASLGAQNFLGLSFPSTPINTLYLDWELEQSEVHRRLLMISKGMNIPIPRNLSYYEMTETLEQAFSEIKQLIKTEHIGFLVIDSLGASCVNAEQYISVVELFGRIKHLGIPSLLIDHQSKMQSGDSYELKTPFGSVYKQNLSRSSFQLSVVNKEDNVITLLLRHRKTNFGSYLKDLVFDMTFENGAITFYTSKTLTQDEERMFIIWEALAQLETKTASNLLPLVKFHMGKSTMFTLLKKGIDKYWAVLPGNTRNGGSIYEPFPTFKKK